jgi:16S rRNA (guanine527-N7)-methyltransferase
MLKYLLPTLEKMGIAISANEAEKLEAYHKMLLEASKTMNLTAITEESEMADKHYADSLSPLMFSGLLHGKTLIDVGTGAGFPGLPIAIMRPEISVTLLDSLRKRLDFLKTVMNVLELKNVTLVHARAEDAAFGALRRAFDIAVARAVAPLPVLLEYTLPFVKVGGSVIAYKGPSAEDELNGSKNALARLGGGEARIYDCTIGARDWQHKLVSVKKASDTPRAYPRKAGTPSKAPL